MAQQSFDPESPEPLSNQARNGLKAESGFTCYTDYLEAYKDRLPCHSWLANVLYRSKRFRITNKGLTSCDILDLVKNDHSQMSTPIRYRTSRGDKLLGAPRQAPEVACVQIVLWRVPKSAPIDVDLVDALGLGLKLDPQFFEALTVVHQLRRDGYEGEIRPFEPNHVVLGEMIATITNCYVSERSDTIPVILIADSHIRAHDHNGVIQIECREFPPFRQLDRPKSNHEEPGGQRAGSFGGFEQEKASFCAVLSRTLKMASIMSASIYICTMALQSVVFRNTRTDHDALISEARRLEAEIRDYLQFEVGDLSLRESKKSIELSVSQIQEAKRVKIFTILAFIYVPLNLATSIFGMNIQQLNQSGQNISTFLGTAVIALAGTGASWFLIEQINSYLGWRGEVHDVRSGRVSRPTYSLGVRLVMLIWLARNGHWIWMRRTKAWWYILANSRPNAFQDKLQDVMATDNFARLNDSSADQIWSLSAGDYVSRFSKDPDGDVAFRLHDDESEE